MRDRSWARRLHGQSQRRKAQQPHTSPRLNMACQQREAATGQATPTCYRSEGACLPLQDHPRQIRTATPLDHLIFVGQLLPSRDAALLKMSEVSEREAKVPQYVYCMEWRPFKQEGQWRCVTYTPHTCNAVNVIKKGASSTAYTPEQLAPIAAQKLVDNMHSYTLKQAREGEGKKYHGYKECPHGGKSAAAGTAAYCMPADGEGADEAMHTLALCVRL
ncbi:hypothetical protein CYMTET_21736 [Cymbomonas tetramitiformis]|uniref:Uncharacterized protein n=1 Tax=Cymbomonas tetramitiformis TaxID=36881 RepID=A0AAE0L2X6_9CHLO|nr:hypothetical protein CYMTET_21736 [Cymbomonas tetramitiformis]